MSRVGPNGMVQGAAGGRMMVRPQNVAGGKPTTITIKRGVAPTSGAGTTTVRTAPAAAGRATSNAQQDLQKQRQARIKELEAQIEVEDAKKRAAAAAAAKAAMAKKKNLNESLDETQDEELSDNVSPFDQRPQAAATAGIKRKTLEQVQKQLDAGPQQKKQKLASNTAATTGISPTAVANNRQNNVAKGAGAQKGAGKTLSQGKAAVQQKKQSSMVSDPINTGASGNTFTRERVQEVVEQYGKAWSTKDIDLLLDVFTDDAMYIEKPTRFFEGRDQIKGYWEDNILKHQTNVNFRQIDQDLVFDEETSSAVCKWEASFEIGNYQRKCKGVWCVIMRFRLDEASGTHKICWFEEFWHRLKDPEEENKGKGYKGNKQHNNWGFKNNRGGKGGKK